MKGLGIERKSRNAEINMAPLIDMVFILLIFFLVTTSFVRESGVEVKRPIASTADAQEKTTLIVAVTEEGMIYIDEKLIDIRSVRSVMERFKVENPKGNVVITADRYSLFGVSIEVLDEVRAAGITNVVVAATKE
ncbi:MAG TPA: biopolymer transporter ExbD [Desulfatiglandales bacterium]|nr:biopolymer transporter ExbD [Desulfatiglandales bacterium]